VAEEREEEGAIAGPEGPLPRTWREAIPYVVWVVIVLGFGLEFVNALTHAEWWRALASFLGLGALMAAVIHWNTIRFWVSRTNPNFILLAIALFLLAIILSPFVEQRRLPFGVPSGSIEVVSKADYDALSQKLAEANSENANLKDKLEIVDQGLAKIQKIFAEWIERIDAAERKQRP